MSKDMVGLFFEDINFAADGGLYAELIENRSFEALKIQGNDHNYVLVEDSLYAWSSNCNKQKNLQISINEPLNEKNPHYLHFTSENKNEGFVNKCYDGLFLKKNLKYYISFYCREVNYINGNIKILITKDNKTLSEVEIPFKKAQEKEPEGDDIMLANCELKKWTKYNSEITLNEDIESAKFEIILTEKGCLDFDLISFIPSDAVNGIFRKDLFEALKELNPGFLRFPGGCIVEGTSLLYRYYWKNTVDDIEKRKIIPNLWGAQGGNMIHDDNMQDNHYMQSYGIGFYEFFVLCELLSTNNKKCKPVPVLNIGVACQFRSYQTVDINSEEFNNYVQDALDLIEFANGDVDTKYGKLREKMGHKEKFNLEIIAIGNEQWESKFVNLFDRYKIFEQKIHEKYPNIKLLGTAGPFIKHHLYDKAWNFYRNETSKNENFVYAVDEHYYVSPDFLYKNVNFYDNYPRNIGIFAGEYAGHDLNLRNSVESGLAEAAMMTGFEKNGDIIKLASYAPLFNRVGHSQWTPDLIWFDEKNVIKTMNFYVQKIFSVYNGVNVVDLEGQEKKFWEKNVYISVIKDEGDKKILKIVNANESNEVIELNDEKGEINTEAEIVLLRAKNGNYIKPEDTGSVNWKRPNKAVESGKFSNLELCKKRFPEEVDYIIEKKEVKGKIEVPAKSVMVVKF